MAVSNSEDAERLYQAGMNAAPKEILRGAIDDLKDFLHLFPEHQQAQAFRERVQHRLAEIESVLNT